MVEAERPAFLEFFAGAGLVRLGLEPEWSCTWANDIDNRKAETYQANFGNEEFLTEDIANVTADLLPPGADLAWASFPCQDLSLAGNREGLQGERSGTVAEFLRLMREMETIEHRPPIIVLENVVGLLYDRDFPTLCRALSDLGTQFGTLVIDARLWLPQSRPRVFMVAVEENVPCSSMYSEAPPEDVPWFPTSVKEAQQRIPHDVLHNWRWWNLPIPSAVVPPVEDMIEDPPSLVEWHTASETKRLLGMMSDLNREKTDKAVRDGKKVGFVYKRTRKRIQRAEARFDGLAGCLRTPEGGSSRQIILTIERGQIRSRLLSPREAARLMGVPERFTLPDSYNDAYQAIGDGVAVPVTRWMSHHLLLPLKRLATAAAQAELPEGVPA